MEPVGTITTKVQRARDRDPKTGAMRLSPPHPNAHHLIKFIYVQMMLQGMTAAELDRRSGVPARTIKEWFSARRGYSPRIVHLETCLQVLGFRLKPTWLDVADETRDTTTTAKD